ncbi:nucleoside triphosphate pyrophosphohydrolase [bacterium]|jgi:MazG family protein|nr:nucleoside triphosphate pyrophosphohydrolase [bacterium]MBT3582079.1 nucleoside triphosphate pyrophosphohydrolase [bacterium]MBT4552187.1 nucleoside triphosphate pyrophosphohydrolase [bacterium]MBT5988593.1 nucleoside triphosphate pyrophosphohydrolase [bacterium]MBT7088080.1 nucleoside triphosphate pyrophosphohydrolase [bacterium]
MEEFKKFVEIVKKLRKPDGCPWDIKQTPASICPHLIEESYEIVDAVQNKDTANLKEEIGDTLISLVMLANMAEEKGHFNIQEVLNEVTEKLVRRHPHVFADTKVAGVKDVLKNWEQIKKQEKEAHVSAMDSVPKSLPALMQAQNIQKKAARLGFDWDNAEAPLDKIAEEIQETKHELAQKIQNKDKLSEEIGDIFFSVVNFARKLDLDSEEILKKANKKFSNRFKKIESEINKQGKNFQDYNLAELEELWQKAKK